MDFGLGLPIGDPASLLDWGRRADATPFRTLGLLDRLVYDNPEPLVTLAALAGATSRIRLQTEVLIAPVRDTALLAKQAATLDRISAGRFTLGLGVGGRADDYLATGFGLSQRGRRLDEQLATMRRLWAGKPFGADVDPVGPAPFRAGGPEILFGAFAPAALDRVARWGDGFLCAAPLSFAGQLVGSVERSWAEAGRAGRPRLVAQVNTVLGPDDVVDAARSAAHRYYGASEWADHVVASMAATVQQVLQTVAGYADLGVDEVVCYCWADDPTQVERFADVLF